MEHILHGLLYVKPIYSAAMRKEGWFMTPGKLLNLLTSGEDIKKPRAEPETESDEEPSHRPKGPLIRVNLYGEVYDLTDFAPRHPGGARILERVAENSLPDATPLFESYHAMKDPEFMRRSIKPFATGEKASVMYSFEETGFYRTVRRRVIAHLREHHPAKLQRRDYRWSHAKALLGFLAWVGCLIRAAVVAMHGGDMASTTAWSFMAGVALISWGFVMMHDASHFAFTRSPAANEVAAKLWNTVAYWDSDLWEIHHAFRHHSYTGTFGLDPDMDHAVPLIRKTSQSDAELYMGFSPAGQVLSITVFPGMYLGQIMLYSRRKMFGYLFSPWFKALGDYSISKCVWWQLAFSWWLPVWFIVLLAGAGACTACVAVAAYGVAANVAYAVNILPDHDTRPSHLLDAQSASSDGALQDWGEMQVRSSGNWSGQLWCEIWGGINYQIEHHLFPTLHHSLLPEVATVVRSTCEEMGVPYTWFPDIYSALSSVMTHVSAVADEGKQA
mmetsp:Transcript_12943/g.29207  ORF Transcript_12943/g.29207 Transcript_12943/m.29207 type:complete len:500 (+) Transcript_12943:94-1593(+)